MFVCGAVVAPDRRAVNEKIAAAAPAYVTERDRLEHLVVTWCPVRASRQPGAKLEHVLAE